MVSTKRKPISFYNQDLYDSIKIPVRDYLLELTGDLELAVLLNQIIFSKKEKMTLNDIKKLSLNEKTKQTIRVKLERLIELGLIRKYKNNNIIYNQDLYEPTNKIISDNQNILALIDGSDLKYIFHYLTAVILNKFRSYALSGINEVRLSARQLQSMLGVNNSESSIRAVLKQLVEDDYIDAELVYGVYNYKINVSKITNNFSIEDIEKFTNEIFEIYKEYLNRINIKFSRQQLNSYKMIIKRMLNDGYNPSILKHIFTFITLNYADFKDFTTPSDIKKSYDKLNNLSRALSNRKAKRFIYKLKNNLLNLSDEPKAKKEINDVEIWNKAVNFIETIKTNLKKWFYTSLAGVTDIDFEDYCQEALKTAFEYFKKNNGKEDKLQVSAIKYRLQDFMYHKRSLIDTLENKNTIINYEYDFENIDLLKYNNYSDVVDTDETNQRVNNILSVLDERSRLIVKHYIGIDGISLSFKEIGSKLNITESYTARIYKKAILLLKEHYPPDKMAEFKKILLNNI